MIRAGGAWLPPAPIARQIEAKRRLDQAKKSRLAIRGGDVTAGGRPGGKSVSKPLPYPASPDEPLFITEEIAAEMIAAGYEFEPPPIPCTIV